MAVHWFVRIAAFSFFEASMLQPAAVSSLTWKLWDLCLPFKAICLQRTPRKKKKLNHSSSLITLPSSKLTWQWKMDLLKMYSLLKMGIFAMLVYWSVSLYAHLCSSHSSHFFLCCLLGWKGGSKSNRIQMLEHWARTRKAANARGAMPASNLQGRFPMQQGMHDE